MTEPLFMKVGGLDPSLSNFGMSRGILFKGHLTIEGIALITTKADKTTQYKNMDDLRRATELSEAMEVFFHDVNSIYVEIPVGSQSARAMASYGICVGILSRLGKKVIRVSAKEVKVIATNNPQASKADMITWATESYPDLPWLTRKVNGEPVYTKANEHVADSIASIHAGLNNN